MTADATDLRCPSTPRTKLGEVTAIPLDLLLPEGTGLSLPCPACRYAQRGRGVKRVIHRWSMFGEWVGTELTYHSGRVETVDGDGSVPRCARTSQTAARSTDT